VFEAVKKGNKLLDRTHNNPEPDGCETLAQVYADIQSISGIMGIFLVPPGDYFKTKKDKGVADMAIDPAMVDDLIEQRMTARKEKNFARADEIRDQLQEMNILLEDGPQGTTWTVG